jgi:hypothetical protein
MMERVSLSPQPKYDRRAFLLAFPLLQHLGCAADGVTVRM